MSVYDYLWHIVPGDLYLILRTWTELKDCLSQLKAKGARQSGSHRLQKIENRLTFHLMVALREYCGLPLDPKRPDKPSWPPPGGDDDGHGKSMLLGAARLESDALLASSPPSALTASAAKSSDAASSLGDIKKGNLPPRHFGENTRAICCHCRQILDYEQPQETLASTQIPSSSSKQAALVTGSSTHDERIIRQRTHSRSRSRSRREGRQRSRSMSRKELENKSEATGVRGKESGDTAQESANRYCNNSFNSNA